MKKKSNSKGKPTSVPIDPYLEGLMAKLLERLTSLERKMDAVLAQTTTRSSATSEQTRSFENPSPRAEQPRRERVMHESICADCQKVCEVPFKPAEGRAIYCKPCFASRKLSGSNKIPSMPRPVALYQKQPPTSTTPSEAVVPADAVKKERKSKPVKKAKKRR